VNQIAGSSYSGADTISNENRLATLLELLSQLETSEVTVGELNRLLTEAEISVRVC
jgi:hypothetical protein